MKAIFHHAYGSPPEVLDLHDVETPPVGDQEVLVEVHAAAVGGQDRRIVQGEPYASRLVTGLRRPTHRVPGREVAGRVLAIGSAVTTLQPGDEVFGRCRGAFAERVAVAAVNLERKPANLTFAQAAAVPVSGSAALRAVRDAGGVHADQHVLIIGASGSVGSFAVQIAKALGAAVTGVCATANTGLVRSIGADHVIDYTLEDVAERGERYDVVIDLVGARSLSDLRRTLRPDGTVVVTGEGGRWFHGTRRGAAVRVLSPFMRHRLGALGPRSSVASDLAALKRLAEARRLTPIVSAHFSLAEVPAALCHFAPCHMRGKISITV